MEDLLLQKVDDSQGAAQPNYDWPRPQSERFAKAEVDLTRPAWHATLGRFIGEVIF